MTNQTIDGDIVRDESLPLAKIEVIPTATVLGNFSGSSASPSAQNEIPFTILPDIANNTILGNSSGSAAAPSEQDSDHVQTIATDGGVRWDLDQFNFFSDATPEASVGRYPDRLMVGYATDSNTKSAGAADGLPGTFGGLPATFYASYLIRDAALGVIPRNGLWGIGAMTRSSDSSRSSTGAIGCFSLNDKASATARALYLESQHLTGATASYALEVVTKNQGTNGTLTPYGGTASIDGIRLTAGGDSSYGGDATANSNVGLYILGNGTWKWNKGIIFNRTSLNGADGTSGGGNTAQAIELSYGQGIRWISSNGTPQAGRISSVGTSSSDQSHDMQFANNKVQFVNVNAKNTFDLVHVASGENQIRVTDAISGSSPIISAIAGGSDTALNLTLTPLGTGVVASTTGFTATTIFTGPQLNISGNVSAAAWTTAGIGIKTMSSTYTDTSSSGTVASTYAHSIAQPTLAASSSTTYTNATTLNIEAPTAGTNVTIGTANAIRINGRAQINGLISGGLGASISGASVSLNASSNFAVNIGTGTTTGGVNIAGSSNTLGFFAATAAAKQTVTGSRGGNAALADLLSKLATYGLITDSTSA